MPSESDQTEKEGADDFGLDDRSLEELKEKAIAAKERAYCRCLVYLSIYLSIYLCTWST